MIKNKYNMLINELKEIIKKYEDIDPICECGTYLREEYFQPNNYYCSKCRLRYIKNKKEKILERI